MPTFWSYKLNLVVKIIVARFNTDKPVIIAGYGLISKSIIDS